MRGRAANQWPPVHLERVIRFTDKPRADRVCKPGSPVIIISSVQLGAYRQLLEAHLDGVSVTTITTGYTGSGSAAGQQGSDHASAVFAYTARTPKTGLRHQLAELQSVAASVQRTAKVQECGKELMGAQRATH